MQTPIDPKPLIPLRRQVILALIQDLGAFSSSLDPNGGPVLSMEGVMTRVMELLQKFNFAPLKAKFT